MKVSISLRGDNSDEYHIRLESWDRGNLPDEIIPLLEDADIIDVVLERVSGLERTSMHVLSGISEVEVFCSQGCLIVIALKKGI